MTSLSDLYELNTKQYRGAADRIGDPGHRLILLQMVRAWLDARPRCPHRRKRHLRAETRLRVLKNVLPEALVRLARSVT